MQTVWYLERKKNAKDFITQDKHQPVESAESVSSATAKVLKRRATLLQSKCHGTSLGDGHAGNCLSSWLKKDGRSQCSTVFLNLMTFEKEYRKLIWENEEC